MNFLLISLALIGLAFVGVLLSRVRPAGRLKLAEPWPLEPQNPLLTIRAEIAAVRAA